MPELSEILIAYRTANSENRLHTIVAINKPISDHQFPDIICSIMINKVSLPCGRIISTSPTRKAGMITKPILSN